MNVRKPVRRALLTVATAALLSLPALAQAPTPPNNNNAPVPVPVKFFFNGYVQGRFSDTLGEGTSNSSFDIKRAYVNLRAEIDQHISAVLMASGVPTVSVKEAYGEYKFNPEFRARLGLSRIPFGYELPASSSQLITLERSQAVSDLLATNFTFDRGAFAYYTPTKLPIFFSAGVTNGTFTDTTADPDANKNVVGRLGYLIPGGGQIGVSGYIGQHPTSGQTMNRIDGDLEISRGDFTLQSELIYGKGSTLNGTYSGARNASGGYATLAYRKPGTANQPYVRFDTYDPDRGQSNTAYTRETVGINHYLTGNSKLTLEYQFIDDRQNPDIDGFLGAQYQVSF